MFARSIGKLKTSGFAFGFQHFPRYLGNVNEWKIMFDRSIAAVKMASSADFLQTVSLGVSDLGLHCLLWSNGYFLTYDV